MRGVIFFACAVTLGVAQWTPDPLCPYPSYDPTRIPVPGDCTKYYECMDGTKTELTCPDGLEFNAALQECDPPEIANCNPDDITTTTWTPPTELPKCTATGNEIDYYPYEGDCTKYWECYQGHMYLHQCPVGYEWNQDLLKCDLDENVVCKW